MELELGLKITRTKDDVSSSTDFRVSRDSTGQLSLSRETNSVFNLILHLKGFKKEDIDIEINKEGNRIQISGIKHVEEMVLITWVEWKKEIETKEFKKVYRIPEIVDLDKIKARFDEEDGTLVVTMPKKVKGFSGLKIEEEEEEKTKQVKEKTEELEEKTEQLEEETEPEEEIKEEAKPEEEETIEEEVMDEETNEDEEEKEQLDEEDEEEEDSKPRKKRRKKCKFPFVAGSTLLMSIIVFIIQFIQSRRK